MSFIPGRASSKLPNKPLSSFPTPTSNHAIPSDKSTPREDAQPNEQLMRNSLVGPPTILSATPRFSNVFRGRGNNGRRRGPGSLTHREQGTNGRVTAVSSPRLTGQGSTSVRHALPDRPVQSFHPSHSRVLPSRSEYAAFGMSPRPVMHPADRFSLDGFTHHVHLGAHAGAERPTIPSDKGRAHTLPTQEKAAIDGTSTYHEIGPRPSKRHRRTDEGNAVNPSQGLQAFHISRSHSMQSDSEGPGDVSQSTAASRSFVSGASASSSIFATSRSDLSLGTHEETIPRVSLGIENPTLSSAVRSHPSFRNSQPASFSTSHTSLTPMNANDQTRSGSQTVKRERSPSPVLDGRRLVTEGCVLITPLPPECRKSNPTFQAARRKLSASELQRLRALGLQTTRVFTRDDGMVIDWKSDVPVWSDTLRPPPVQEENRTAPNSRQLDTCALPSGLQPTFVADGSPAPAPLPQNVTAPLLLNENQEGATSSSRASVAPSSVSEPSSARDSERTEAAALDYLKRYMTAFSEDRSLLARAYSRIATLSILNETAFPPLRTLGAQRSRSYRGRADIVAALVALPEKHALCDQTDDGMAELDWELLCTEPGDILLICYATRSMDALGESGTQKGKGKRTAERWAYIQRFILRRKEWDQEDRENSGLWPLVAVSHQMSIERIPL